MSKDYFENPESYDPKNPLPEFNSLEWEDGFVVERYRPNGFKVNGEAVKDKKGRPIKLGVIKFHSKKNHKHLRTPIRPMLRGWLSEEHNRTVLEIREYVKDYADTYNQGYDPLTFAPLDSVESFEYFMEKKDEKGNFIDMKLKNPPKRLDELKASKTPTKSKKELAYGEKRNQVVPDMGVYQMLLERIFTPDFVDKMKTMQDQDDD